MGPYPFEKSLPQRRRLEQKRIKELEKENTSLRLLVEDLLEKLNKLQNRKNSNNSYVPPSKDENRPRKTKSLRKKSEKNFIRERKWLDVNHFAGGRRVGKGRFQSDSTQTH